MLTTSNIAARRLLALWALMTFRAMARRRRRGLSRGARRCAMEDICCSIGRGPVALAAVRCDEMATHIRVCMGIDGVAGSWHGWEGNVPGWGRVMEVNHSFIHPSVCFSILCLYLSSSLTLCTSFFDFDNGSPRSFDI